MLKIIIVILIILCSANSLADQSVYGLCIGSVVNGVCYGATPQPPVATCYGQMVNGQCIGTLIRN